MTVTYSLEVSTSKLATFAKLLFRWKGGVYKLLWRELVTFLILYYMLNFTYRFVLDDDSKRFFEKLSDYCEKYTQYTPLTFILGFYLNIIYERWWQQWEKIQWPDRLAMYLATYLHGRDERGRMLRRTIIRYLNLSAVLGLRSVSSAVLKRFPTMAHLIEAGFLTEQELKVYESIQLHHPRHFVPCTWASTLLHTARKEERIDNDRVLLELVKEVNDFLQRIREMTHYDWISVPLVYTQVVTLAVYSFFVASLFGRQFTEQTFDLYFPFFTVLQLLFYMGWLKVAEVAINPFGEDEDDFEVNFILERNLQVSYSYVDDCYNNVPLLEHDLHWNKTDFPIPHTAASWGLKGSAFHGSTLDIRIAPEETEIVIEPSFVTAGDEESQFVVADEESSPIHRVNSSDGAVCHQNHLMVPHDTKAHKRSLVDRMLRNLSHGSHSSILLTRPVGVSRANSIISTTDSNSAFHTVDPPMFMSQKRTSRQHSHDQEEISRCLLPKKRSIGEPESSPVLFTQSPPNGAAINMGIATEGASDEPELDMDALQTELIRLSSNDQLSLSLPKACPKVSQHSLVQNAVNLDTIVEDPKSPQATITRQETTTRVPLAQIVFEPATPPSEETNVDKEPTTFPSDQKNERNPSV